jgi:hypothetical protein
MKRVSEQVFFDVALWSRRAESRDAHRWRGRATAQLRRAPVLHACKRVTASSTLVHVEV